MRQIYVRDLESSQIVSESFLFWLMTPLFVFWLMIGIIFDFFCVPRLVLAPML